MKKVLFVNSHSKQCGVHQYGLNFYDCISKSDKYEFDYIACSNISELIDRYNAFQPDIMMVNFSPAVLAFLDPSSGRVFDKSINLCILHEAIGNYQRGFYDYFLLGDPGWRDANEFKIAIPRILFDYENKFESPSVPTFATFGFAYPGKDYAGIVKMIQSEYDEAILKIHVPANSVIGDNFSAGMLGALDSIKKPGISIVISKEFLEKQSLLDFLGCNTANIFIYDKDHHLDGISSVIDYGISCKRPLIINRNSLFRHISNRPIVIGENSIKDIVAMGLEPLNDLYNKWSDGSNIKFYEELFDRITK